MTEPLLTISAFARAVGLSPSALRYYDEAGVLPPVEVDPQTGYRYYTPALQHRAQLVRRMREIGVPVETMRTVLHSSPDKAARILQGIADQAAESARRAAAAVADVVTSMRAERAAAGPVVVLVHGPELGVALTQVSTAAGAEPDSPLAVVLLDITESGMNVVATDRYWLAMWSIPLSEVHVAQRRLAIPISEIEGLVDWLSRQDAATLSVTANRAVISGGDSEREIVAAEDRFPAYRLLIDDQSTGQATVEREPLLRLLGTDVAQVRIAVGPERVTVSPDDGFEGAHLSAITSGAPIAVRFSASLLRSALSVMVGSAVTMSYQAADRAVRLTSAYQRNLTVLVMPVRIDQ